MKLHDTGVYLVHGVPQTAAPAGVTADEARKGTIAYGILKAHNTSDSMQDLRMKFDSMTSHDITYVGIIQTARASGMKEFPLPYVMTNCHNSLCAVGGTINEDDHQFALSAAHKYGGIYVPPNMAVIHSYNREMMSGCGRMILGSDSHTRYGALGTMAVGEGGGELAKQLVGRTYDMSYPGVVAIYLTGKPAPGVGPHDVALALVAATYANGYVKNKVMEFVGPGVANLSADYRNGIDVMTTETTCWSSVWQTDDTTKEYFVQHGRPEAYKELKPADVAYYDGCVRVNLSEIRPMIALPFHPSNIFTIDELNENPRDIFRQVEKDALSKIETPGLSLNLVEKVSDDGCVHVDQGIIAGCSGGVFDNIIAAAQILKGKDVGCGEFSLSVYPGSQPAMLALVKNGAISDLMEAGAVVKTAFCGPCFGAGDTPANHGFSIRHTTRNFPNREGSKPGDGQLASVALMDARSIAATAANGGVLTSAEKYGDLLHETEYSFDSGVYEKKVYHGFGKADASAELIYGPNIRPWPKVYPLAENLMLKIASVITDPVTTTDELIPSGETSSLRSNPIKLAQFALSRKDPKYVGRAHEAQALEDERREAAENKAELSAAAKSVLAHASESDISKIALGSCIFAVKPGDGSAREQAASSQKVLGGQANFAEEYATKRYRSNLINWGMIPFIVDPADRDKFKPGEWLCLPGIRRAVRDGKEETAAWIISEDGHEKSITVKMPGLAPEDREILLAGCLMNYYAEQNAKG